MCLSVRLNILSKIKTNFVAIRTDGGFESELKPKVVIILYVRVHDSTMNQSIAD